MNAFGAVLFLGFVGLMIWVICKSFINSSERKQTIEEQKQKFNAVDCAELKHNSGLPFPEGVPVEVFYGKEKITFKKDEQIATVDYSKIRSIDVITGSELKKDVATGAIAGKYIIGGLAGAAVGALLATSTYLVIGYESNNENKTIILDTAMSGLFSNRIQKFYKENFKQIEKTIEL